MNMRPAPPGARPKAFRIHRQRGVAVITALLLTTLAITIVASLFWQQQVQVRSIENQRLQLQKQWILRGALDWAGLILREDAKHSSVDDLNEPWAVPLAETRLDQYVENGRDDENIADATLSGGISDAQARYNLTNMCPNGTIAPAEVAVFARLLGNAKLDPALAQATAELMATTLKKPKAATASRDAQPGPQPMALAQVDDLLAVPGFTPLMLDKLKDFIIFLPRATPVNVNTAPAEVLAARIDALSLSEAVTLVENRNTASFRNLADFTHRLPGKSISLPASDASVITNYFLVNGKVRMNRAGLEMQSLIERNGSITKLIRIREY
ncbi:MAG: type II secretion system minor pseudopilin GspK [Gallionella sp.]|nr:type II secretion system minor pseudopilin GspK [Gallionella sp.]